MRCKYTVPCKCRYQHYLGAHGNTCSWNLPSGHWYRQGMQHHNVHHIHHLQCRIGHMFHHTIAQIRRELQLSLLLQVMSTEWNCKMSHSHEAWGLYVTLYADASKWPHRFRRCKNILRLLRVQTIRIVKQYMKIGNI